MFPFIIPAKQPCRFKRQTGSLQCRTRRRGGGGRKKLHSSECFLMFVYFSIKLSSWSPIQTLDADFRIWFLKSWYYFFVSQGKKTEAIMNVSLCRWKSSETVTIPCSNLENKELKYSSLKCSHTKGFFFLFLLTEVEGMWLGHNLGPSGAGCWEIYWIYSSKCAMLNLPYWPKLLTCRLLKVLL